MLISHRLRRKRAKAAQVYGKKWRRRQKLKYNKKIEIAKALQTKIRKVLMTMMVPVSWTK